MPRRFTRTAARIAACAFLAAALATDARAQAPSGPETASSGDRLAVTIATGSALGLLYHLTPRLAIHPELNVSRQQVEGFPSSTAVNGAVAVRFYPSRAAARTRPFIAGRYSFGRIIRDGEDLAGPQVGSPGTELEFAL